MSRILIKNGYVVTVNESREVFAGEAVAVADGRVQSVKPSAASYNDCDFEEVIDATGCLVMPGLINMQQHFGGNIVYRDAQFKNRPPPKEILNEAEKLGSQIAKSAGLSDVWLRLGRRGAHLSAASLLVRATKSTNQ